jgi:hypothetical protein
MSYVWTFEPDTPAEPEPIRDNRLEYEPRPKKKKPTTWVAPEHMRYGKDMRRDFPRNAKGERIEGKDREIAIDPRPTIMVPPRPTRIGWL